MQEMQRQFNPWVSKIFWRREWLPTPVFLPGELHGQRNVAGYSPWGSKESDTTEKLTHKERTLRHFTSVDLIMHFLSIRT